MHGAEEAGLSRVVAQGAPDLGHEPRQVGLGDEGLGPEAVPDLLLGDRLGPAPDQEVQEVEGLGLDVEGLSSAQQLPSRPVEDEVAEDGSHGACETLRKPPEIPGNSTMVAAQIR